MRALSGLIILILYYTNTSWASYMPINSNSAFDNTMQQYNVSRVLSDDNTVNREAYLEYGPPYYAIANLYVTGANFVYYTFSVLYVFIKFWKPLKKAFYGLIVNTLKGRSTYHGFEDGNTRLMRRYKDVPEWWYGIIFATGFAISIIACEAWPTQTPWWSIIGVTVIGTVLTIPWVIIESIANTGIQLNVIWQLLPGLWFPGKPMPQLVIVMLGGAFEQMAGNFTHDLKYAHYARLPPRAVFRGHVVATVVNCFTYCVMLDVMLIYFNNDATLCRWDNTEFMVCQYANSVYASTIFFGAFGTNNMFKLYPMLPYCFLFGAILAGAWLGGETFFPKLRKRLSTRMDAKKFSTLDKRIWGPMSSLFECLNPAIALSGALQWAGNNNLTYATLGIYIAWFFQYYLKRRYTAWWGKYAYLIFAGLSVGVAISGLIVTLVFSFGVGQGVSFNWWGNTVQRKGFDWEMYNQVGALNPIPEKGYFGIDPENYPTKW
jgi:OPT family oligopeptide transporter